jgi:glutathione S-transferase
MADGGGSARDARVAAAGQALADLLLAGAPGAKLTSIAFSHYCERARWALERASVPVAETRALPLFHVPFVAVLRLRAGGGQGKARRDAVSSPMSTPVLVLPRGAGSGGGGRLLLLQDSGDIVLAVDAAVAAAGRPALALATARPDVAAWCARFHDDLGPSVRTWAYAQILPRWGSVLRLAWRTDGVSFAQRLTMTLTLPLSVLLLRVALGISDAAAVPALAKVRDVFRAVDAALEGGRRPYLCDGPAGGAPAFSAADLTFAALAGALVLLNGEGYGGERGVWLPPPADLGPTAAAVMVELRDSPAGQHVLKCYRKHRRAGGGGYGSARE